MKDVAPWTKSSLGEAGKSLGCGGGFLDLAFLGNMRPLLQITDQEVAQPGVSLFLLVWWAGKAEFSLGWGATAAPVL